MAIDEPALLGEALAILAGGFSAPLQPAPVASDDAARVLREVATRMQDNFPYHDPLYAGQMLKPPHPVARLAYSLALSINPNNHALDGGRASSAMEKEAVAGLAEMVGFERHIGHLCSGGTVANLEALWVATRLRPEGCVIASELAHYTHERLCAVLGIPFRSVPTDRFGRLDPDAAAEIMERETVGTVVATLGTTGLGAVDPLHDVLSLQERFGFRVHVDAAYGGYFTLVDELNGSAARAFAALPRADSVVVDPHKHGLQPYGCGCVLFSDPEVGRLYAHDSPYTYFTSSELHLGEISLECSRPGASAVALWATQRLLPLVPDGDFAHGLGNCLAAARALHAALTADAHYLTLMEPELDIVTWAAVGESTSEISRRSQRCFERAAERGLHLALLKLPVALARCYWGEEISYDSDTVTCLRSVLMKPEHHAALPEILGILEELAL